MKTMEPNILEQKILTGRNTILGYIRKKVGDPELAEDILQDSLLKALRASPELREEEKLLPWFYQIVNNAITDLYRRHQVELKHLATAVHEMEGAVEPEETASICRCIEDVIPAMKPEYAELIRALELGNEDPESVADRLGINRNNLKVRRHRARTQLREKLEETCRSCAKHGCLDCSCRRG